MKTTAAPTTLAALTADPQNRRLHDARNIDAITAALKEVGAARSIVIDEDNVILAGNGVTQAAQAAGLKKLRVIEATGDEVIAVRRRGLTDAQKRALALYDNRTAELASWNIEQLLADQAAGLDLGAWWTDEELAALLSTNGTPKPGRTDPDAVPEVRATDIQRVDLFELGAHRLLCGDSTVAADVARVMGEERADLVFTSPPYAQQRDYGAAVTDWDALMRGVFGTLPTHDATQVLVNLGLVHHDSEWVPYWDGWIAWMREQGWRRFGWYVWDQGFGLPGDWNGRLAPSFEFVFHFNRSAQRPSKWVAKQPGSLRGRGPNTKILRDPGDGKHTIDNVASTQQPTKIPDSVIRILRQQGRATPTGDHPAVFPVALPDFMVRTFLALRAGRAFDPFIGSGTTIVACEQHARACAGIEIEPQYVQVAIDRWEAFTGQRATKVGEVTRHTVTNGRKKTAAKAATPPPEAAQPPARRGRRQARPRRQSA